MTLRTVRKATLCALALIALGAIGLEAAIRAYPFSPAEFLHDDHDSLRIRDHDGTLLREIVNGEGERGLWTPLARMSPLVLEATIAVEDARFYSHSGVDLRAVARAVVQDVSARRIVSGASTLTMQLARNLRPHARTVGGKLSEMLDAWRLERVLSKQEILEQYLNRAHYGAGTVGVEAASRRYFGKPSIHLSLAESAILSGLPKGPSALNPLRNPMAAQSRAKIVLASLEKAGRVEKDDIARALRETVLFARPETPSAMHFTDWIRTGHAGGGDVRTTLDAELQREVEDLVNQHVGALATLGITNAAVVVLDNSRCEILSMIGSADYWDPRSGSVNGAVSRRQPGSTLKPFTYSLAFEKGYTPASTVADVETRYGEVGGDLYIPQNFTREFSGPVLMSDALGRSLNVPAIRVAGLVGADQLLDRLRKLGFESLDRPASYYGLGLTLGNGEVTLLELAQAYATLARSGQSCTAVALADGPFPQPRQIMAERAVWLVRDVLTDETTRIRAFGTNNALMLGFPVAVKTGTSTNWRDNWAVGFTDRYTVAVWAGDFGGRSLDQLVGANGAGPLFNKVMTRVTLRHGQPRPIPAAPPAGIVEMTVCATSGHRAGPDCAERRRVRVPVDQIPEGDCPHHRKLAIDVRNGLLAGPKCPAQWVRQRPFEILPAAYADWQADHGRQPPTRYSPLCPAKGQVPNALVVTWPRHGEVFVVEPGYDRRYQTVELEVEVDPPSSEVYWRIDGQTVAEASWPYKARWELTPGKHRLEAMAGTRKSEPVEFEVR